MLMARVRHALFPQSSSSLNRAWSAWVRVVSRAGCLNGTCGRVTRVGLMHQHPEARERAFGIRWVSGIYFWTRLVESLPLICSKSDFEQYDFWAVSKQHSVFPKNVQLGSDTTLLGSNTPRKISHTHRGHNIYVVRPNAYIHGQK